MKKAMIGGLLVQYYDGDILELPVVRFNAFQRFLLIDAGIGSTVEDADKHVARIQTYIKEKAYDKALVEAQNFRQNIRYTMEGITPKDLAFCALVHSVNGQPHTDMSDEGNSALRDRIHKHTSRRWLDRVIDNVKKKVGMA